MRKSKIRITRDRLNRVIETMGDNGVMQRQSEKKSIAYSFLEQSGNKDVVVATDILKLSSGDTSQVMQTLNLR